MTTPAPLRWPTEIMAGSAGAAASLAIVLTLGLLAYAPVGGAAAQMGIAAAFASVVIGGAVAACISRSKMPAAGPSSATALIFAALVAQLVRDPAFDPAHPAGLQLLAAVCGACVAGSGLLQMVFGLLRLGSLAKFVPQPVLSGFMNGIAILILLGQLPLLLGLQPGAWAQQGVAVLASVHPLTLATGLATAALVWGLRRWLPGSPATLLGLAGGTLLHALLVAQWPDASLAPQVGPLQAGVRLPDALARLPATALAALWQRHAQGLLTTALLLALIGSLESILSALAVDQSMNRRHDANRELIAMGSANVASGLCGGLPVVNSRTRSVATLHAGGSSRWAALAGCVVLGAVQWLALPLLGQVPLAVMAGLMLTVALALMDGWTHQLVAQWWAGERGGLQRQSLLLVATVCAFTLWLGFAAGVAVGTLLAMLVFMRNVNRSLLRSRGTAAQRPSRRIYPPQQESVLASARARIALVELEGALFFGSAERMVAEVEQAARAAASVVLDFSAVSTLDATGAVALQSLSGRLAQRGTALLLAGVQPGNRHGRSLRACGTFRGDPRDDWFADADRATEAAEQRLLAAAQAAPVAQAMPLAACELLLGLDAAQQALVCQRLKATRLQAGEHLFRAGDAASTLYVLTEGSISVIGRAPADGPGTRFVSFSPGMTFGEVALLDGGGRTADAVADSDAVVHALGADDVAALQAAHPALAALLYRNLARHLSQRLRAATAPPR